MIPEYYVHVIYKVANRIKNLVLKNLVHVKTTDIDDLFTFIFRI